MRCTVLLPALFCCLVCANDNSEDLLDFGTRVVLETLAGPEIEVTRDNTKAVSDVLRWWFGKGEYAKSNEFPEHALLGAPEDSNQARDGYIDLGHRLLVEWLSNVVNKGDALQYAEALADLGVDRFADLYELEEHDWPDVMKTKKLHLGKVRRAVEAQRQQEEEQAVEQAVEQKQREEKRKEVEAELDMSVRALRQLSSEGFVASDDEPDAFRQLEVTLKQAIKADVPQALVDKANDELGNAKEAYSKALDEQWTVKNVSKWMDQGLKAFFGTFFAIFFTGVAIMVVAVTISSDAKKRRAKAAYSPPPRSLSRPPHVTLASYHPQHRACGTRGHTA